MADNGSSQTESEYARLRNVQDEAARRLLEGEISEERVQEYQLKRGVLESWAGLMNLMKESHHHDGNNHHDHIVSELI